jgi:ELWxxDGT repeat protein
MSRSIRPREQGQVKVQPFASVGKRRPSAKAGNNRRRNTLPDLDILEARTLLSTVTAQLIKDVNSVDSFPSNLTPAGSNLFSLVEDSTGSGPELEVTSSAGVSQGLLDFSTNSTSGPRSPSDLTPVGNNVYFLARSASSTSTYQDDELWMSDGTAGGTVQVSIPDPNINYFTFLTAVGNTAIVALEAGNTTDDYQAWAIPPGNGTPTMLADFGNVALSTVGEVGGTLYLSVGSDLWTTDGTQANTQEVTGSGGAPIVGTENVFAFNNKTYAFSDVGTQTTIGTLGASGVTPIVTVSSASSPVVVGSKFYFAGGSGDSYSASQLWVSDGTSAGTQMLDDFSSISSSSRPSSLTAAGADLFFTVAGADGLDELWMTTGTSQGTVLVKDLGISPSFFQYSGYSD